MARQAQLRGDIRAQQDVLRSNDATISRLQSEASSPSVLRGPLRDASRAKASCLQSEASILPKWRGSLYTQTAVSFVTPCTWPKRVSDNATRSCLQSEAHAIPENGVTHSQCPCLGSALTAR